MCAYSGSEAKLRLEKDGAKDYHLSMEPVNLARFTRETMLQAYSELAEGRLRIIYTFPVASS